MADVATLGIAVESSQVRAAAKDLNQLSQASASAQKAADNLTQAGQKSSISIGAVDSMAKRARVSVQEMQARIDAAAAGNIKLASASSSAVKGIQQLSRQASRASNDNKALGEQAEKTTGSLEKFATRFTRGLIAGVAIATVQQLTRYLFDLNAQLAATADTAQRVGIGGQQFQGLQTAAGYKGIGGNDFSAAMISFNQQIDLAKHGLGDLKVLLSTNGKVVGDTATTLGTVADLVQRASGDYARQVSILQQVGLPATQQWVQLFEQGGGAIEKIAASSTKLSNQQLEEAKKLNDKWNELWTNFENWGKKAAVNTAAAFRDLTFSPLDSVGRSLIKQGRGEQFNQDQANAFYGAVGIGNGAAASSKSHVPAFDPNLARQQIGLEQQRLGLLGPLATAQDVVRAKQLEINAAALNNVGISKQQADALKLVTLAQFEMNRVNQQAQIGVFNLDAANKAAQDTLKAWVAQKLLDPANEQQMAAARTMLAKSTEQLADAAKVAAAPLEGLQRLINEGSNLRGVLDNGVVSGLNSVESALVDITSGTVSAADGFKNLSQSVIRAIEQMIIKITIITPLAKALQAALGGFNLFGGGVGTGLSLTGTGGLFANGGVFPANDNGISRFSSQVVNRPTMFAFANGVGLMGEAGAEAIMPLQRGADGKLGVRAAGGGGGVPVINIINQSSQPVTATQERGSNGDLNITLRDMVRGVIADDAGRGGPITKTMKAAVGGFNGQ